MWQGWQRYYIEGIKQSFGCGFTELVPEKHIARKWRFKSWPKGGFATITLTFVDRNGENELCLEG
ncbi:hypothetical protein Celaphus_00002386 [Cervus elaphus hippelaphus]|uniref:Activator of Hsp90 ATPase homologue 1/2-like C-terminal domain-containing protein n=1 Tax=Cervus elaphus hippelaphus TaxID=46360 RepID=A0A212CGY5_CEREH|nr:hypothetical protein Celaphus_00002386 [Cervus elaphus hippelaphus]